MVKTPHRLIHDAKEAGAITEQEWRAFMRARNEADKNEFDHFIFATYPSVALEDAFSWKKSDKGRHYWQKVYNKLYEYEPT